MSLAAHSFFHGQQERVKKSIKRKNTLQKKERWRGFFIFSLLRCRTKEEEMRVLEFQNNKAENFTRHPPSSPSCAVATFTSFARSVVDPSPSTIQATTIQSNQPRGLDSTDGGGSQPCSHSLGSRRGGVGRSAVIPLFQWGWGAKVGKLGAFANERREGGKPSKLASYYGKRRRRKS